MNAIEIAITSILAACELNMVISLSVKCAYMMKKWIERIEREGSMSGKTSFKNYSEQRNDLTFAIALTIVNVEESRNQAIIKTAKKRSMQPSEWTKRDKWFISRDTWLWKDDVQIKVCGRKRLYLFLVDKKLENGQIYKNTNSKARKRALVSECPIIKVFMVKWRLGMAK